MHDTYLVRSCVGRPKSLSIMSAIATVYAQTLYQIALQEKILPQVYKDVCHLLSTLKNKKDLTLLIKNPTLPKAHKQTLLTHALQPHLHPKTLTFLLFTIQKKRYTYLENIFQNFITHYKKAHHIHIAHVHTPTPPTPALKKQITNLATKLTGHTHIELVTHTNPNLLGGYTLQIDHKKIDTSLATQIKHLKYLIRHNHA